MPARMSQSLYLVQDLAAEAYHLTQSETLKDWTKRVRRYPQLEVKVSQGPTALVPLYRLEDQDQEQCQVLLLSNTEVASYLWPICGFG